MTDIMEAVNPHLRNPMDDSTPAAELADFRLNLDANKQAIQRRREAIRTETGRPISRARKRWLSRAALLRLTRPIN